MTPVEIIITALAIAFCWVNYIYTPLVIKLNIKAIKPFSCIKCMTGYMSLVIGCVMYGWPGLLFLPAGVFAGAMYEALAMRYL